MSLPDTALSFRRTLRERFRAAALHLLCCLVVASATLLVVFLGWYPPPLDTISGLQTILVLMLGADVTLGPLTTLIIFDRRKKYLKFDVATVVLVQAAALIYGLYIVYHGRPAHLVFVKDRFEVVAPADVRPEELKAAGDNAYARSDPLHPKWVAARIPDDPKERERLLFDALEHGRDVQHNPRLYVAYEAQAKAAAARALPLEKLRGFNPDHRAEIDALPVKLGIPAENLRYLPLKGPARDAAVILRADTGEVLRILPWIPW